MMGTFTVGCLIKNHADRDKSVRIPRLLVTRTAVPATQIDANGIEVAEIRLDSKTAR